MLKALFLTVLALGLVGCATASKNSCPVAVARVGGAGENLGYVTSF